ncbi:MAG: 50S ribosomal protein L18 [Candidatus Methanomethyliales bacterium]|nr:50S ribosomal protein L18 [Candidatus Methanomethylicales archaeon]
MAKGPTYRVAFRRRREGRTDYHLRKRLVSSRKPRLVVRKSLKHLSVQLVEARVDGDRVLASATTIELKEFGWKGGTGNLPAAYLVGFLLGKRALSKGFETAVLDLNGYPITKGSRLFAALKGALDAGMQIPHSEEILPADERIKGEHIAKYAELLQRENPAKYQSQFSKYISIGLPPESIVQHFETVKETISKKVK